MSNCNYQVEENNYNEDEEMGSSNGTLKRKHESISSITNCSDLSTHSHDHCHSNYLKRSSSAHDDDGNYEEKRMYSRVIATFKNYKRNYIGKLKESLNYINSLPLHHVGLLSDYVSHLDLVKTCVGVNQNIFDLMTSDESPLFENQEQVYGSSSHEYSGSIEPSQSDFDKLNSVLKQIMRDWSSEGENERTKCYDPLISELNSLFPHKEERSGVKVLVPGAGTGRLAHEIVRLGFSTEGNEFSIVHGVNEFVFYPWISESVNILHSSHQIRPLSFPDIDPSELNHNENNTNRIDFSMTAGDFTQVYSHAAQLGNWDVVATCFFIDTAPNVIKYVETIYNCLKEGGVWINLGPLLYHYADSREENSIEPPYDFLISIIRKIGFKLEKEELEKETSFSENKYSMLKYSYKSIYFVCRKTGSIENEIQSSVSKSVLR